MRRTLVILLALTAVACADDDASSADAGPPDAVPADAGPDAPPPDASASCIEAEAHQDFTWIQQNVFQRSCVFMSCHPSANGQEMLELSAAKAYDDIVNVPSVEVPSEMRIAPSLPCEDSYLYQKITDGPLIPADKKPMPLPSGGVFTPLCQQKIDAICRWITAGAPND